ncbi:hypothetical protein J6590_026374 [Homalodisca vitripennis]|nr:hypothetical protein J6590_026374 [Homalodisca vitripennis]
MSTADLESRSPDFAASMSKAMVHSFARKNCLGITTAKNGFKATGTTLTHLRQTKDIALKGNRFCLCRNKHLSHLQAH